MSSIDPGYHSFRTGKASHGVPTSGSDVMVVLPVIPSVDAGDFSGTTEYVFHRNDFTIDAWIRGDAAAEGIIATQQPTSNTTDPRYGIQPAQGSGWALEIASDGNDGYVLQFRTLFYKISRNEFTGEIESQQLSCAVAVNAARVPSTGEQHVSVVDNDDDWHHVAGVRSGSVQRLYVDGWLVAEEDFTDYFEANAQPGTSYVSPLPFNLSTMCDAGIGGDPNNPDAPHFYGRVDEVRFWNIARSRADIVDGMHWLFGPDEPHMVGCWGFDDKNATAATDRSFVGNNGFFTGSVAPGGTVGTGNSGSYKDPGFVHEFPQCIHFPGSGTGVQVPAVVDGEATSPYEFGTDDFSIEMWILPTEQGIIASRQNDSGQGWAFVADDDGALLFVTKGSDSTETWFGSDPNYLLYDASWHHVAAVRQAGTLKVFLDGTQLPGTQNTDGTGAALVDVSLTSSEDFWIGRGEAGAQSWRFNGNDRYYYSPTGYYDEVRLWNRALTQVEIGGWMYHALPADTAGLVGRWAFDINTNDDDTAALDSSAYGHTGTIMNGSYEPAAFDFVPVDQPYLLNQVRLMDTYQPVGNGDYTASTRYRLILSPKNYDNSPRAARLLVWATELIPSAYVNGVPMSIPASSEQAAWFDTNDRNQVVIELIAKRTEENNDWNRDSLDLPSLYVHAEFMSIGQQVVVSPDQQAHHALSQLTGDDVSPLLPDGTYNADASDQVAELISNVMSAAVQHDVQPASPILTPDDQSVLPSSREERRVWQSAKRQTAGRPRTFPPATGASSTSAMPESTFQAHPVQQQLASGRRRGGQPAADVEPNPADAQPDEVDARNKARLEALARKQATQKQTAAKGVRSSRPSRGNQQSQQQTTQSQQQALPQERTSQVSAAGFSSASVLAGNSGAIQLAWGTDRFTRDLDALQLDRATRPRYLPTAAPVAAYDPQTDHVRSAYLPIDVAVHRRPVAQFVPNPGGEGEVNMVVFGTLYTEPSELHKQSKFMTAELKVNELDVGEILEAGEDLFLEAMHGIGDLLAAGWHAVEDVLYATFEYVSDLGHQLYKFALDTVSQACTFIEGFLESIGIPVHQIIDLVKAVFDWDSIVNVQLVLAKYVEEIKNFTTASLSQIDQQIEGAIDWMKQTFDDNIENLIDDAKSNQPLSVPMRPGLTATTVNVQGDYLTSMAGEGVSAFNSVQIPDASGLGTVLFDEGQALNNASIPNLQENQQFQNLLAAMSSPAGFMSLDLDTVLRAVQVLIDAVFEGAKLLVRELFDILIAIVDGLFDMLTAAIDLPGITWLWDNVIFAGSEVQPTLNVLNLFCLLGAAPASIAYKLIPGNANSQLVTHAQMLQFVEADPTVGDIPVDTAPPWDDTGAASFSIRKPNIMLNFDPSFTQIVSYCAGFSYSAGAIYNEVSSGAAAAGAPGASKSAFLSAGFNQLVSFPLTWLVAESPRPSEWTDFGIWWSQWIPVLGDGAVSVVKAFAPVRDGINSVYGLLHCGGFITVLVLEEIEASGVAAHIDSAIKGTQNIVSTFPEICALGNQMKPIPYVGVPIWAGTQIVQFGVPPIISATNFARTIACISESLIHVVR